MSKKENGIIYLLRDLEELIGGGEYIDGLEGQAYEEALTIAITAVEQKYGISLEAEE